MKVLNLYIKIKWEDKRTPNILDVRKNGQKVSKKEWNSVYDFFCAAWWYMLSNLDAHSNRYKLSYKGKVYDVQNVKMSHSFLYNDPVIYKMKIYK